MGGRIHAQSARSWSKARETPAAPVARRLEAREPLPSARTPRRCRLPLALFVVLLCACGKTVVIGQGTPGQLSYHCGSFKAQVQSDEQKEALFESARPLISWAAARDDRARALSIRDALEHHSVVELEWLTIQYRCDHDSL